MADIGQLWQLLKGAASNEASKYGNSPRLADLLMRDKSTKGIRDYADSRLAGEAEARLTQRRMNYTPQQRSAIYPPSEFDVPVDQQIVRYK